MKRKREQVKQAQPAPGLMRLKGWPDPGGAHIRSQRHHAAAITISSQRVRTLSIVPIDDVHDLHPLLRAAQRQG